MPEFRAKLCRGFASRLAFGINFAIERPRRERYAKPFGLPFGGFKIWAGGRRGSVRIADLWTGSGVKHSRRVAYATAHHVLGDEAAHEVTANGTERIAPRR